MKIGYFEISGYKRFNGKRIAYTFNITTNPNIVRFVGPNGSGKSTILNALSPLPDSPSDIVTGEFGEKWIVIMDGDRSYDIHYTYTPSGVKHVSHASIKRIMPDGNITELCESGNISTAKDLIKSIFNMDANYELLSEMSGYNRRSIVAMTPGERKKFMSGLIEELAKYNDIYKALNKRSSSFNALINSINNKISHISLNESQLDQAIANTEMNIATYEASKSMLEEKLHKERMTTSEIEENEKKKKKVKELEDEINMIQNNMICLGHDLEPALGEGWNKNVFHSNDEVLDYLRKCYDDAFYNLMDSEKRLKDLQYKRENFEKEIKEIDTTISLLKASEAYAKYSDLEVGDIDKMINIRKMFIENLRKSTPGINTNSSYIDENTAEKINLISMYYNDYRSINSVDLSKLIEEGIFDSDGVVNRDRFFSAKYDIYNKMISNCDTFNADYQKYVDELDNLDEALMASSNTKIVNKILYTVSNILSSAGYPNDLIKYLGIEIDIDSSKFVFDPNKAGEYILRCNQFNTLSKELDNLVEYKLKFHSKAMEAKKKIEDLRKLREEKYDQESHNKILIKITNTQIDQVKYQKKVDDFKRYIATAENVVKMENEAHSKIVEASALKNTINYDYDADKIRKLFGDINDLNIKINSAKSMLYRYKHDRDMYLEYKKDLDQYQSSAQLVDTLKKYSSPGKGGIQVTFIAMYINNILKIANSILSNLFEGRFVIAPFVINDTEFRIPVIADNITIDDVSSMSTSQMAMISICINMALMAHESVIYRIPKFDEADGPLDPHNRSLFPDILKIIIEMLGCEQAFLVSQNTEFTNQGIQVLYLPER